MNRIKILVFLIVIVAMSCDRTRTSTGWDYMPDMYYSEAYETNAPNENFKDGLTMRVPVEGTIPRGYTPFPYEKTLEDQIRAGKELVNPVEITQETVAAGKERFEIFCINCHGEKGDGKGYLFTSGRYPYPPASLVSEKVVALNDGEIFHAITLGYGVMGAHGSMIPRDQRWQIINYIREDLQQ